MFLRRLLCFNTHGIFHFGLWTVSLGPFLIDSASVTRCCVLCTQELGDPDGLSEGNAVPQKNQLVLQRDIGNTVAAASLDSRAGKNEQIPNIINRKSILVLFSASN